MTVRTSNGSVRVCWRRRISRRRSRAFRIVLLLAAAAVFLTVPLYQSTSVQAADLSPTASSAALNAEAANAWLAKATAFYTSSPYLAVKARLAEVRSDPAVQSIPRNYKESLVAGPNTTVTSEVATLVELTTALSNIHSLHPSTDIRDQYLAETYSSLFADPNFTQTMQSFSALWADPFAMTMASSPEMASAIAADGQLASLAVPTDIFQALTDAFKVVAAATASLGLVEGVVLVTEAALTVGCIASVVCAVAVALAAAVSVVAIGLAFSFFTATEAPIIINDVKNQGVAVFRIKPATQTSATGQASWTASYTGGMYSDSLICFDTGDQQAAHFDCKTAINSSYSRNWTFANVGTYAQQANLYDAGCPGAAGCVATSTATYS
jgi:hypothetical protein